MLAETAKRLAEESLSEAHSRYIHNLNSCASNLIPSETYDYVCEMFEIYAHYQRFMVRRYEDISNWYEGALDTLVSNALAELDNRLRTLFAPASQAYWPLPVATSMISNLNRHLVGRRSYWKSQALKQARLVEAASVLESPTSQSPPGDNSTEGAPLEPIATKTPDTIATQIESLRLECDLTQQQLSDAVGLELRTVQRHLSGESLPYLRTISTYEKHFSKRLKRQVVISKLS